jgi:Dolichyl-phosphate-mannose-protein mannosyltransferase
VFASTVLEQGSVDDSIGVEHRHRDDAVSLPLKATPATGLTLWAVMAIIGIAMVGAAIRVAALLPIGAADQFPVDYDEGVYSAAASLFARGQMPYRDFFFVHPPGALYVLLPLGGFSPQTAFVAARFVMVGVGTVSIALVGLTACRRWGLLAGAVGAAVYACFPEAVQAEHGVFLEPLLNLFCLAALACWLRLDDRGKVVDWDGWALAAGALAAAAFTVKLWAVFRSRR